MTETLQLHVMAHPDPVQVGTTIDLQSSDSEVILGRLPTCGIELVHSSISRRHAAFRNNGLIWTIVDLESRHGTFLNGDRLAALEPSALEDGSQLQFGPFVLCVGEAPGNGRDMMTLDDLGADEAKVSIISPNQLNGLAQHRLDILIKATASLAQAKALDQLADRVTSAAGLGTGAARALMLRSTTNALDFEILGSFGFEPSDDHIAHTVSHSLVRVALEGNMAQLSNAPGAMANAQSIVDLGIGSAICAPVRIDEKVEAGLYLDARGHEQAIEDDAAAFCESLAGFCGLAMANLRRMEIEREQILTRRDLDAARRAQEMIMPSPNGIVGPIRYASVSIPGRMVAGDLFDVIPIDDDRTILMLGDVSGKGAGAAVLMATAQTYLRASSEHLHDPSELLGKLNKHVFERSAMGTFVTMCLAIVDKVTNTLHIADAGHAHWCMVYKDKEPSVVEIERQLPIGIMDDTDYPVTELRFESSTRFLVFSDGLIEQLDSGNQQFGMDRVLEVVASSSSVNDDVVLLTEALRLHAGESSFADDLTIASFERI
ncbi:MAG: SpoIIE family protein phosphatase [Planctomycetota bacterium]|nr:SpoIIE family protein phosphatase [Planctomycetota bacterium]